MSHFIKNFSERLRLVRGSQTRASFADNVGINARALINYESGKTLPNVEFAAKLCSKTGVSTRWLLLGEGSMLENESNSEVTTPASQLVDSAIKATGADLNEKQRNAVISIVEEELVKSANRIVNAVIGG